MIPPATRREFLKQSGALIVTFSAAGVVSELEFVTGVTAQGINGNPGTALDSWIAIAADGRVTAYTGKCELGHGLFTAQTQLIAEMDAALQLPGLSNSWTMPLRGRIEMLSTGMRTP